MISEAASILAKHDSDGDRRLQYDEFTTFLTRYMHAAGYNLVEVGDELMSIAHRVSIAYSVLYTTVAAVDIDILQITNSITDLSWEIWNSINLVMPC